MLEYTSIGFVRIWFKSCSKYTIYIYSDYVFHRTYYSTQNVRLEQIVDKLFLKRTSISFLSLEMPRLITKCTSLATHTHTHIKHIRTGIFVLYMQTRGIRTRRENVIEIVLIKSSPPLQSRGRTA